MYIFKRLFYFLFLKEYIKYSTSYYRDEIFEIKFLFAYFKRYGHSRVKKRCLENGIKPEDISMEKIDKSGEPIITVTKRVKIGLFYFKIYIDILESRRGIIDVGLVKYRGNMNASHIFRTSLFFRDWYTYAFDIIKVMDMVKDKTVYSNYEGVGYKLKETIYSDYHKSYIKKNDCLYLVSSNGSRKILVHKNHIVYSKIHKSNIIREDSKYIKEYNDYVLKDFTKIDVPIKEVINILDGLK